MDGQSLPTFDYPSHNSISLSARQLLNESTSGTPLSARPSTSSATFVAHHLFQPRRIPPTFPSSSSIHTFTLPSSTQHDLLQLSPSHEATSPSASRSGAILHRRAASSTISSSAFSSTSAMSNNHTDSTSPRIRLGPYPVHDSHRHHTRQSSAHPSHPRNASVSPTLSLPTHEPSSLTDILHPRAAKDDTDQHRSTHHLHGFNRPIQSPSYALPINPYFIKHESSHDLDARSSSSDDDHAANRRLRNPFLTQAVNTATRARLLGWLIGGLIIAVLLGIALWSSQWRRFFPRPTSRFSSSTSHIGAVMRPCGNQLHEGSCGNGLIPSGPSSIPTPVSSSMASLDIASELAAHPLPLKGSLPQEEVAHQHDRYDHGISKLGELISIVRAS